MKEYSIKKYSIKKYSIKESELVLFVCQSVSPSANMERPRVLEFGT